MSPVASSDLPEEQRLHPWLPWLAFGVVVGATAPHALSFACGFALSPFAWFIVFGLPSIAVGLAIVPKYRWAGRWLIFSASALLGGALADGWEPAPPTDEPRLMAVSGMVTSVKWTGISQGFQMAPQQVLQPAGMPTPRRLFVRADQAYSFVPGDQVIARGLWQRGTRGDELKATETQLLATREAGPRGWAWASLAHLGAHRTLGESLILGIGDPPEKAAFRQSGLLHILAVSGAHLAIAAGLGAWLLRLVGLSWATRLFFLGVLIIGYTWLTSASPATMRALAMGLAIVLAGLWAREPHRLGAVSLAALGLVVINPANASDLGFQLSLVAVLGIITLGMDFVHLRQQWLPLQPWPLDRPLWCGVLACTRMACDGLVIGFAACLAITPLLAWVFGTANPWSPLTTLAATPPTTLALWAGLPYLVLDGLWPNGPWQGLVVMIDASLALLVQIVNWSATLPSAQLACGFPSALTMISWPILFLPVRDYIDILTRLIAVILLLCWW
jgi:ComEC/Rec2-related protein